jgi:tetratricopeptide (TPR) repeat protein
LPAYYRKLPVISLDEPDLNVILGLAPFTADFSVLPELRDKDLDNPRKGPQALREKLQKETATKIVEQAAALVREKKNDEGIKLFTEALQIFPNFVPALIGRSAAYANQKHFDEAIYDLRIVREIEPENQTAAEYYSTVLMVYGQQ